MIFSDFHHYILLNNRHTKSLMTKPDTFFLQYLWRMLNWIFKASCQTPNLSPHLHDTCIFVHLSVSNWQFSVLNTYSLSIVYIFLSIAQFCSLDHGILDPLVNSHILGYKCDDESVWLKIKIPQRVAQKWRNKSPRKESVFSVCECKLTNGRSLSMSYWLRWDKIVDAAGKAKTKTGQL